MNFNFSIFGISQSGRFMQYPSHGNAKALSTAAGKTECVNMLISRSERVMTYTYTQRLDNDNVIGLIVSINDMEFTKPKALMVFFSEIVSILNADGIIVRTVHYPNIPSVSTVFVADGLLSDTDYFIHIESIVRNAFEHTPQRFGLEKLHGTPQDSEPVSISYRSNDETIMTRTYSSKSVCIESMQQLSSSYLITAFNDMNDSLKVSMDKINDLKLENTRLERTKKQFKAVMGLCGALICILAGLFIVWNKLGDTQDSLEDTVGNLLNANLMNERLVKEGISKDSIISTQVGILNSVSDILCRTASTQSYPSWYSSNHSDNSRSEHTYNFYCSKGDEIVFDYYVDSESVDYLRYNAEGSATKSGSFSGQDRSGTVRIPVTSQGYVNLTVAYEKDGSVNRYSDRAYISGLHIDLDNISRLKKLIAPWNDDSAVVAVSDSVVNVAK